MHSVGNKPCDHRIADSLEIIFNLEPPYPAINFEPYYTGWHHEINKPGGEQPAPNSERDNYFARAQMYGSVLSGGLSGHVHGTAAYDITSTGEPAGARPHFWDALKYESANYMQHLGNFMLSKGSRYQDLLLTREEIQLNKNPISAEDGLDGWSYMMRTGDKSFALLYFENESLIPKLSGFLPNSLYTLQWFNPVNGKWEPSVQIKSNADGRIILPVFPDYPIRQYADWGAKIILDNRK